MLVSGLGLLRGATLAYTEALSRWGSPEVVDTIERHHARARATCLVPSPGRPSSCSASRPWRGASPRRARRRQGWWGTGFGAAGLAVVATSLLDPEVSLVEAGLATGYSLVAGLLLGYLVIRAGQLRLRCAGPRARRLEEASAHRPEPGRTHAAALTDRGPRTRRRAV